MTYQKFPNSKQLTAELNSNKLERIYLFLGEEEGEKDKIINKIIDMRLKSRDEKNYSTRRFHLETGEFQDAAEFAMSASMFSESKICIMLNIDSLKSRSGDKMLLGEVINSFPDSNILVMTSPENKLPSIIEVKDVKKIKVVQFWRLFESDISTYIINSIRKKDIKIETAAVNDLVNLTGRDIKKIDEAIEMLIESGEKSITPGIIKEYVSDTKDVSIFEFIDSLFRKDKSSFRELAKVLDNGVHELALLKVIMRQAELIEKYNHLTKTELNSEAAMQQIGINPRKTKSFLECVKRFPSDSIKKVFPLIQETDRRIKSSAYSSNLASNPIFELVTDMLLGLPGSTSIE
jgi:DNA polymerase III delta subunit